MRDNHLHVGSSGDPIWPLDAEILDIYLLIGQGGEAAACLCAAVFASLRSVWKKKRRKPPRWPQFPEKGNTVSFGGNTFLRFRGNSFFEKFRGNPFFSSKGGWSVQKGGRGPPFLGKRGLPPIFWGAPAKVLIPKILTEFSSEKYRPIPTKKYRLVNSHILPK